jgi:hypothetical protein
VGKRSDKTRRDRDFYPTPWRAVPPLIPYLRNIRNFVEPCCGEGDLVRHLEAFGLTCVSASDLNAGQDALELVTIEYPIITNPPHSRELMHRMIQRFQAIAPEAWLLIDYDWAATRQAAVYLGACSDIVIVPRLKWIAGTKWTGKDNFAWYRFDQKHYGGPRLHNDLGSVADRVRAKDLFTPRESWDEMWARPFDWDRFNGVKP